MINRLKRFLSSAKARWGLDETEARFVKEARPLFTTASVDPSPMRILVQMPPDYQCMAKFLAATQQAGEGRAECVGLWHQSILSAPRGEDWPWLRRLVRRLFNWLDFRKWRRLYQAIGVRTFVNLQVSPFTAMSNFKKADAIWRSLSNKQDVFAIRLNDTPCGDLIYDTYLRYRVQPTVDIRDPYLRDLIAAALNAQHAIRQHLARGNFDRFHTNYSSYIQHGVPVREALRAGIEVYSSGNATQVYKRLSENDTAHIDSHWRYAERFRQVSDKAKARDIAREALASRFSGAIDSATAYMRLSAYAPDAKGHLPDGVEGVVFLHDFLDSPHCYRHLLFADFDEWIRFTLDTIVVENLPFAIKPHPNQLPESALIVEKLKAEYPSVTFIDPKLSNAIIFRSGIKCGVSVYGTVLGELAYHGIPALAAGDHPHIDFDIAITATSIADYRQKLIGYRALKVPSGAQEQMLDFYYAHQYLQVEDLEVEFGPLDVQGLEQNQSRALDAVMSLYLPFVSARRRART